ncbi:MAG: hypothetical protein A4S12_05250 [Proteobacteria bacterium SG_bin5]|nr:retropepsin-like domain-containing protein [Sphingomonas sp.]OQW43276.1 MAG: hypothetical protein A4S12_05250 [Proteobacteria bacterium SG_bin5]
MKKRAVALTFASLLGAAPGDELMVRADDWVPATIEGQPVRLRVDSAGLSRLVLSLAAVERLDIKPAPLFGKASLQLAGRKASAGFNRPLDFAIDGRATKGRGFWLKAADLGDAEARIGPWGVPQARVVFALPGPSDGAQSYRFPLGGALNSVAVALVSFNGQPVPLSFEAGGDRALPLVSAALGAMLAQAYDGHVSGASWDEPILVGITRPVRLLTLAKPLEFGPFRFTRLAVRVPDRVDAAGRGPAIREAGEDDPEEVTVSAKTKGKPIFTMLVPGRALRGCARLGFDKVTKMIELNCRPQGN